MDLQGKLFSCQMCGYHVWDYVNVNEDCLGTNRRAEIELFLQKKIYVENAQVGGIYYKRFLYFCPNCGIAHTTFDHEKDEDCMKWTSMSLEKYAELNPIDAQIIPILYSNYKDSFGHDFNLADFSKIKVEKRKKKITEKCEELKTCDTCRFTPNPDKQPCKYCRNSGWSGENWEPKEENEK